MAKININLAKDIAKVNVKFDAVTKEITLSPEDGNVRFKDAGESVIEFNLMPVGADRDEVEIVGITFPDGKQPGGNFAPGKVFSPKGPDIPADPGKHPHLQSFGETVEGYFRVADDNQPRGNGKDNDYEYLLWVHYPKTSTDPSSYYEKHPKVSNEDPPPTYNEGSENP